MPTYTYRCEKCKDVFDVEQRITEDPLPEHPDESCKGPVVRLIPNRTTFVLNGGGWYKDGY